MLRTLGVIAALFLSLALCSGCGGASGSSVASTPAANPTAKEGVGSAPSAAEKRAQAKQEQHYEKLIERERQRSLRKQAERRTGGRRCQTCAGRSRIRRTDSRRRREGCSIEAPAVVEKAYHEAGPSFDGWAIHYAKETHRARRPFRRHRLIS
jgi:hypothetical protein